MSKLAGKKVLFVSPKAFGYEIEILEKMRSLGATVDYFDERPSNSSFVKASIRINRQLVKKRIFSHYEKIIASNKQKKYDYIFFIHLETPYADILKKLREVNPTASYFLYMWDSMLHRPNTLELTKYFDKVITFDRLDANRHGFFFRPLFYLKDYIVEDRLENKYDISFLGTVHSDRYKIINNIKEQVETYNLKTKWFLFLHNKMMFYKLKFSSISNINARSSEFNFKAMPKNEVVSLIKSSFAILDIQHPENNGLTMRTLEVLGSKRKLITTNKDIINYDFYKPNNVLVIDRNNPILEKTFFESPFIEIDKNIYNNYSIDSWINDIFNN